MGHTMCPLSIAPIESLAAARKLAMCVNGFVPERWFPMPRGVGRRLAMCGKESCDVGLVTCWLNVLAVWKVNAWFGSGAAATVIQALANLSCAHLKPSMDLRFAEEYFNESRRHVLWGPRPKGRGPRGTCAFGE